MASQGKYFDVQVNGYAGIDFNQDDLTAEDFHTACEKLRDDGVEAILATVITDEMDAMTRRLARLSQLREKDALGQEVIYGIHIEGPFISEVLGYVGAHPAHAVLPATIDGMQRLLDAAGGLTQIVTLAPEQDPGARVTKALADSGILVAAGHSDATTEQLTEAIDNGLSMFTHLGNGCPMTMHRHDNIVQRVLNLADRLWISFIADGSHIPFPALANYLRCAGLDRSVIVTDAISAAGLGPGRYDVGSQTVTIEEDLVPWADDRTHFVGSATIMPRVEQNLRDVLGLSGNDIEQLTYRNPRQLLGS
jgi:N-acetylglucosamine-6-phosphate deacetylase